MAFSSPRFLVFLAILLGVLSVIPGRSFQKRVLMVASCAFYAAWDYRYLGLLATVSVIDYFAANRIHATEELRLRKAWLLLSVASNLGILAYFKYVDFFIDNLNGILSGLAPRISHLNVLLPAGISFFTFKTMSYTIDVYRRELEPQRRLLDYATFVTFFPELIAGPIVRASVFLPQMGRDIRPSRERLSVGSSIFLVGLTKKLLVADVLARVADPIFASPELYSGVSIWLGVIAYALQIYCDFSGYSDMAIGVAKMFGYDLPRNFCLPYLSGSVTEFWRRWHITLSTWLRDYLYIPLGGNRHGRLRTHFNLFLTMLLGGLWHGASWNFVIWGALHGAALIAHRGVRAALGRGREVPYALAAPFTFLFVIVCWVPFRSTSFDTTRLMLSRMFTLDAQGATWLPSLLIPALTLAAAGHLIGGLIARSLTDDTAARRLDRLLTPFGARLQVDPISGAYVCLSVQTIAGSFLCALWVLALLYFAPVNTTPFIYFQF